jgi:hypothetical protein
MGQGVSTDVTGQVTVEQLKGVMPPRQRANITQGLVDELNQVMDDPSYREQFRENLLGYTDVLQDPNLTLPGYISAVKYVSYKMLGMTNENAWKKTFPDRFQRLLDEEKSPDYIRSVVSAYARGKTIAKIFQQAMMPVWILNQDKVQAAINVQAKLMLTARSEKVRSDAANSLLTHLKQPEATKVSLDIQVKQDETIPALRKEMTKLAAAQREALASGAMTPDAMAAAKLIEAEVIEGEVVE